MFTNDSEGEVVMLLDMRTVEKEMDNDNLLHRSCSGDPNLETVSFSVSGQSFFLPAVLEIFSQFFFFFNQLFRRF